MVHMNDLLNDVVVFGADERNDSRVYIEMSLVLVVGDEDSVGMDNVRVNVDEVVGTMVDDA